MILVCTPAISADGSFLEAFTPAIVLGGSFVEQVSAAVSAGGAMVECCSVPFHASGTIVETLGVDISTAGALLIAVAPDSPIAAVFTALAMNTKTAGVALYESFPLTALFKVGLEYFGITADGLVRLTGDKDDGLPIDALIVSGVSDLGTDQKKNICEAYLTMRCEGDLEFAVVYDERKKIIKNGSSGKRGLSCIRFALPLGPEGNQIQTEIRNVDGANFDLKDQQIVVVRRDRRR